MVVPILVWLLTGVPASLPADRGPERRPIPGQIPPFHGDPAPPAWLQHLSQATADIDCRHYLYEAYASPTHWMARYVMLPEGDEAFRELEQIFLYPRTPMPSQPSVLKPSEVAIDPVGAAWHGERFRLVDRRDLWQP